MYLLLALLSAFTAALVAIFGKIGLSGVDSTVATTVRAVFMAAALVLTTLFIGRGGEVGNIGSRDFLFIILSGLAGAASWLFYFAALKLGPASKIAPVDRLSLVFVIIFAGLFLGEKISWKMAVGVVLMVGGAVLTII